MKLALYGILVILGLFIILMVFNPRLSCFGRKLKSPFYPVYRKKKQRQREMKVVDYGFDLENPGTKRKEGKIIHKQVQRSDPKTEKNIATEDYGFDLRGEPREK
jgi:hypothetical protein